MVNMQDKLTQLLTGIVIMIALLPTSLALLINEDNFPYNSTHSIFDVMTNGETIQTLLQVIIPLLIVIGIVVMLMEIVKIKKN